MTTETLLLGSMVFCLVGGVYALYRAHEPRSAEQIIEDVVDDEGSR